MSLDHLADWIRVCQAKALDLAGTPEGDHYLAESRRLRWCYDEIRRLMFELSEARKCP